MVMCTKKITVGDFNKESAVGMINEKSAMGNFDNESAVWVFNEESTMEMFTNNIARDTHEDELKSAINDDKQVKAVQSEEPDEDEGEKYPRI